MQEEVSILTPMEEQKILNEQLEAFKKQNPQIVEAMRVLHMDLDQYFRTLSQMAHPSSTSSNKAFGG